MKKLALALGLLSVGAASQAAINFNISNAYQTATLPNSGMITVTFSGTVDVLLPTWDAVNITVESPGNGSAFLTFDSFDAGFVAYLGSNAPGVDYTGNLFSIQVNSTDAQGFYYLNGSSFGMSALSEAIVYASVPGGPEIADNEYFGVNVVPEPATMAALGLGAIALIRKRRSA